MALDSSERLIAVGLQGEVVRYNTTGTIEVVFTPFPGISAQAVQINSSGNIIVAGKQSFVVQYNP